ncbi:hypothetical protein FVE85_6185 [Porphyridium purpureum]|uniref:Transcription initiation factor TFIID component TAF4 C-terminal domain-containing protein n=1 Tax=Porphyridium purpureum TaxID=35688 RepID=A0A5J4Z5S8_PORPP|nr:hypothetical protein FVE85_6185 [Porphyridium purpureum]|eukprot:POR0329..scf295_1
MAPKPKPKPKPKPEPGPAPDAEAKTRQTVRLMPDPKTRKTSTDERLLRKTEQVSKSVSKRLRENSEAKHGKGQSEEMQKRAKRGALRKSSAPAGVSVEPEPAVGAEVPSESRVVVERAPDATDRASVESAGLRKGILRQESSRSLTSGSKMGFSKVPGRRKSSVDKCDKTAEGNDSYGELALKSGVHRRAEGIESMRNVRTETANDPGVGNCSNSRGDALQSQKIRDNLAGVSKSRPTTARSGINEGIDDSVAKAKTRIPQLSMETARTKQRVRIRDKTGAKDVGRVVVNKEREVKSHPKLENPGSNMVSPLVVDENYDSPEEVDAADGGNVKPALAALGAGMGSTELGVNIESKFGNVRPLKANAEAAGRTFHVNMFLSFASAQASEWVMDQHVSTQWLQVLEGRFETYKNKSRQEKKLEQGAFFLSVFDLVHEIRPGMHDPDQFYEEYRAWYADRVKSKARDVSREVMQHEQTREELVCAPQKTRSQVGSRGDAFAKMKEELRRQLEAANGEKELNVLYMAGLADDQVGDENVEIIEEAGVDERQELLNDGESLLNLEFLKSMMEMKASDRVSSINTECVPLLQVAVRMRLSKILEQLVLIKASRQEYLGRQRNYTRTLDFNSFPNVRSQLRELRTEEIHDLNEAAARRRRSHIRPVKTSKNVHSREASEKARILKHDLDMSSRNESLVVAVEKHQSGPRDGIDTGKTEWSGIDHPEGARESWRAPNHEQSASTSNQDECAGQHTPKKIGVAQETDNVIGTVTTERGGDHGTTGNDTGRTEVSPTNISRAGARQRCASPLVPGGSLLKRNRMSIPFSVSELGPITMRDFLFFMERDPNMRSSILIHIGYVFLGSLQCK